HCYPFQLVHHDARFVGPPALRQVTGEQQHVGMLLDAGEGVDQTVVAVGSDVDVTHGGDADHSCSGSRSVAPSAGISVSSRTPSAHSYWSSTSRTSGTSASLRAGLLTAPRTTTMSSSYATSNPSSSTRPSVASVPRAVARA